MSHKRKRRRRDESDESDESSDDEQPWKIEKVTDKLSIVSADFALNLLRTACSPENNGFFSPMSISVALAMTYAGADGETKKQMNDQMFGGLEDDEIHEGFSLIVSVLNEPKEGYQLLTANKIYGQKDYTLLPEFVKILMTHYQSEMKSVDFENAAEATRVEINTLVEQITKGRIKDLIASGILDALTRLVLVNAIYFKGNWKSQFKERRTIEMTFYSAPGKKTKVQMMRQTEKFLYKKDKDVKVLGMHMLQKTLLCLSFFQENIMGWQILKRNSLVEFPKFKMEQSFSLKEALSTLGMPLMFDGSKADFSKMTGNKDLYVSAVLHKAFIEVNEEGTVAAAATAVVVRDHCLPEPPPTFIADHPFTICIFDKSSDSALLMGHLVN